LICEVNALSYPEAALFGFCLALMAYNAVAVMKAAFAQSGDFQGGRFFDAFLSFFWQGDPREEEQPRL
jgi:hypothetical protein